MPDSVIANYERYRATPNMAPLRTDSDLLAWIQAAGRSIRGQGRAREDGGPLSHVVESWKNADPELQPAVAEVRQRLARRQDVEKR